MRILTEPKNALVRQYQRLFEFENVRLRFTDDALETVADLALQRKVGARGLRMILEDLMLELMYHLPAQRKLARLRGHRGNGQEPRNQLEPARKSGIIVVFRPRRHTGRALEISGRSRGDGLTQEPMFNREKLEVKRVPMMPVRDMVIFPQMMHPFIVGREASVRALEEALAGDKKIFLATQHDASVDDPKPEEIYQVGTLANIVQSVKLPDGNINVLVEGTERAKVVQVTSDEGFFRATVRLVPVKSEPSPQTQQASERVTGLFEQYVKLSQSLNYDTMIAAVRVEDPGKLSDAIAANLQIPVEEKQELLEIFDPRRAPEPHRRHSRSRNRKAQRRPLHQHAREAPDGARPERVLPQRKAQGHPEGTRARRSQRNRAAQEEDRNLRHARRAAWKRPCRS